MKNLLLSFFIMLFVTQQYVFSGDLTFVQATDTHLRRESLQLTEFVKNINSLENIDFVVFTGDNIDNANIDDLKSFLREIKRLKVRPYVLIGNHDVFQRRGPDKDLYMKTVRKYLGRYHSDKAHYTFIRRNIVFVVLDGTKQVIPGANGYFTRNELQWLDKILSKYQDKKVVIFQHYPLLDTKVESHMLYKKEEYLAVLNRHNNVISIISGHYHKNMEENINGIYHIVTPPLRDDNYKIITIDDENYSIYTFLVNNKKKVNYE